MTPLKDEILFIFFRWKFTVGDTEYAIYPSSMAPDEQFETFFQVSDKPEMSM